MRPSDPPGGTPDPPGTPSTSGQYTQNAAASTASRVILVHGYGCGPWIMRPLGRRLRRDGFSPEYFKYRSLLPSIRQHASALRHHLLAHVSADYPTHLVTHSMGGIITLLAMQPQPPTGVERIVLLAPPIHGTPIARWVPRLIRRISKPLDELAESPTSLVSQLPNPPASLEIGIIASRSDQLIPLRNTKLAGATAHLVLPGIHESPLFSANAAQQISHFFRTGHF